MNWYVMRVKKWNVEQWVVLPLIVFGFTYSVSTNWLEGAVGMSVALIALNVLSCRSDPRQKVLFLGFNFAVFVFLVGRSLIALLFPRVDELLPRPSFDFDVEILAQTLVFVSLLVIRISFSIFHHSITALSMCEKDVRYRNRVMTVSRSVLYITIPFQIAIIAERIVFVLGHSYEDYYVYFESAMPLILSRVAGLYEPLLFLYLATFPPRRSTTNHLLTYIAISSLSLGYGQRGSFALSILFAVIYLALRDVITPSSRVWLSRKIMFFGAQGAIALVIFFAAFSLFRSGSDVSDDSIFALIPYFFVSQGSAVFNLAHAIDLQNTFPSGRWYSIGPLIEFLRGNVVSTAIIGLPVFPKASTELALEGHNFSFALAYLVNPLYYSVGGGYGSNFIAELWIDFGMMGVLCGSAIFGVILARGIPWTLSRGPFFLAFAFAGTLQLLYSPRAEFLGFLSPILSMPTIASYIAIHALARTASRTSTSQIESDRSTAVAELRSRAIEDTGDPTAKRFGTSIPPEVS